MNRVFRSTFVVLFLSLLTALPVRAEDAGTVLITGANRGIGLALAEEFSKAGFDVIGTARKPERAKALKATGARVVQLDVTDQASVDAMAKALDGVAIDIVINNAGVALDRGRGIGELDMEAIERTLDVNTLGPIRVTKALYPNVKAGDRKVFANISSMMGSMEMNTWGCCLGYRASKAALNSANQTLAVDLGKEGVTFVVFHPGYVQTDMNEGKGNITPEQSAVGLTAVISKLDAEDNGKFYDWQGKELPW